MGAISTDQANQNAETVHQPSNEAQIRSFFGKRQAAISG